MACQHLHPSAKVNITQDFREDPPKRIAAISIICDDCGLPLVIANRLTTALDGSEVAFLLIPREGTTTGVNGKVDGFFLPPSCTPIHLG